MTGHDLAQLNIAVMKETLESPGMADFVDNLEHMQHASLVLWWVPRGHRPDIAEAMTRPDSLRSHGPSQQAFSFGDKFPPPAEPR